MGYNGYNQSDRQMRTADFQSKSTNQIFEQNTKRQIHSEMNPSGVTIRESRDSEAHPNSIPIILVLDITGSMGHIPEYLVKEGLPKLVSFIIEAGIPDPQIMFLAIGDHNSDSAPLQISQFESGDAELDMWLTRVWLEGNGGGNFGESYSLAHYFAAKHTATDNWDKRKQKGFLFTIGDERNHPTYPGSAMKQIMGTSEASTFTSEELLKAAQEKWNVFHIHPGIEKDDSRKQWKEMLGENALYVNHYQEIPALLAKTVISNVKYSAQSPTSSIEEKGEDTGSIDRPEIML